MRVAQPCWAMILFLRIPSPASASWSYRSPDLYLLLVQQYSALECHVGSSTGNSFSNRYLPLLHFIDLHLSWFSVNRPFDPAGCHFPLTIPTEWSKSTSRTTTSRITMRPGCTVSRIFCPADKLEGRDVKIFKERDRKL